jgi:hypothetical protein
MSAQELWLEYLAGLQWQTGNLDTASYDAFLRAANLGVASGFALEVVAARIEAAGGQLRPNKLANQWRRASAFVANQASNAGCGPAPSLPSPEAAPRPSFCLEFALQIAGRVPPSVDTRWIKRRSPVPPAMVTPAEYLSAVFPRGDCVLVFSDWQSQGETIYQNTALKVDRKALGSFERGHAHGVWFLANPVDGQYHYNPRQGGMSRRSEESITSFRNVVLESDCLPALHWLKILVQVRFPILSIISSGGKSLHALLRIDAKSKADWDRQIKLWMPHLVKAGADRGALTAVRLTRLANCYRGDRLQELLYLNPDPPNAAQSGRARGAPLNEYRN